MTDILAGAQYRVDTGDCLARLRELPDWCCDCCVTDPPYGCGKADWDERFPVQWYKEARRVSRRVVVITGSIGLSDTIPLVGHDTRLPWVWELACCCGLR